MKTVVISGRVLNQASVSSFQVLQSFALAFVRPGLTTRENAQLVCVLEIPRHLRSIASGRSAARQADAWLSPITATVCLPWRLRAPNQQARTRSRTCNRLHGALGISSAASGEGVTRRFNAGLKQGCNGSRAAAP